MLPSSTHSPPPRPVQDDRYSILVGATENTGLPLSPVSSRGYIPQKGQATNISHPLQLHVVEVLFQARMTEKLRTLFLLLASTCRAQILFQVW